MPVQACFGLEVDGFASELGVPQRNGAVSPSGNQSLWIYKQDTRQLALVKMLEMAHNRFTSVLPLRGGHTFLLSELKNLTLPSVNPHSRYLSKLGGNAILKAGE